MGLKAVVLRRWSYRLSALLAVAYVVYVLALKWAHKVTGGPLGDVGEFVMVLVCVALFALGLFADEASRAKAEP